MQCRICESNNVMEAWNGPIRDGGVGNFTKENIKIYKCCNCGVFWHNPIMHDIQEYYESNEYRDSVDGDHEEQLFYKHHDEEVLKRLEYTGTMQFRNKRVADVGCAVGTFLDYLNGVASEIVAVEPSDYYRSILEKKGYEVYRYADEFVEKKGKPVDLAVSFSVLEHVENPISFLKSINNMLQTDGKAIIGTPSDAPLMCELLGDNIYEKEVLYSSQHLWIFTIKSMEILCEKAWFKVTKIASQQRYGMANLFGWLKNEKPRTKVGELFCDGIIDAAFYEKIKQMNAGDYIVAYLTK